jgi:hypothetical protein
MWKRAWPWLLFGGIALAFASIVGWLGRNFWTAVAIALVVIVANGLFATLVKDYEAGFKTPDGQTPKYVRAAGWFVRVAGLVCVIMIAVLMSLWAFG